MNDDRVSIVLAFSFLMFLAAMTFVIGFDTYLTMKHDTEIESIIKDSNIAFKQIEGALHPHTPPANLSMPSGGVGSTPVKK